MNPISFNPQIIGDILLLILVTIGLITDIKYHKIYNKWTFPNMVAGLVFCALYPSKPSMITIFTKAQTQPQMLDGIIFSFEGWLLALALMYLPFAFNVFGGGDVKLLMAVGAYKGPDFAMWAFLFTLFFGALLSLGLMIKRGNFQKRMSTAATEMYLKTFGKRTLASTDPNGIALYGIAIFVAVTAAWFKFQPYF